MEDYNHCEQTTNQPLAGFGPAGKTGNDYTIAITSFTIQRMVIDLIVEVDDGGECLTLAFGDFDSTKRQQMPLIAAKGPGAPTCAPLRIPYDCERLYLEVYDEEGNAVEERTSVLDIESLVFMTLEEANNTPLGMMPKTHNNRERENLRVGGSSSETFESIEAGRSWNGISLHSQEINADGSLKVTMVVKDRGMSKFVRVICGNYAPTESKVVRAKNSPQTGVISLDCPADSDCLGLEFYTADGEFIPFLGCRYLLRTQTFFHSGITVISSEQCLNSNAIVQEIMSTKPDASAGGPGTFILEHRINIIGFRKQGNMHRFIYIVDEPCETASFNFICDEDESALKAPAQIFPLYHDAGPLFTEVWIPEEIKEIYLEARNQSDKPVEGASAVFDISKMSLHPVVAASLQSDQEALETEVYRSIQLSIEYILQKKVEFGPRGVILGNKALSVVKASRDGESAPLNLTLLLDDGGHFESVCWWHQKMEYVQSTPLFRTTPSCPAAVELAIPDPQTVIYLDFVDSNGRTSTSLSVVFDMGRGILRAQEGSISPARDKYKPSSTDASTCRCLACKRDKPHQESLHISDLPEEERYHLLSSMKFDWDYCYLCDKCRHRINDTSGASIAMVSHIQDRRLREGAIGLFKAYFASFFIFLTPGQFLIGIFTSMPFYFSPGGATFTSTVLLSALFCMLPVEAIFSTISSASKLWDKGNIFRQFIQMIGIPAVFIAIFTDFYFSFKYPFQYPVGTNPFTWSFLYYAAITGFCIGTTTMSGLSKVLHSGAEYKKVWDSKFQRAARILSGMSSLVHVERISDLHDGLKRLLSEEMNVEVFIVFKPNDDGLFKPKYAYGTAVQIIKNWKFKAGDAGLPGQSLFFKDIMDIKTYEEGLDDITTGKTPFPALWCIPVTLDSKIVSLLTISAFKGGTDNSEMGAFLPALSAIISAAHSNIQRLDNIEKN